MKKRGQERERAAGLGILQMMEYQVPQFIEVEEKIVGPLTLKQFIYVAGTVGLCIMLIVYLPIFVAILLCIPIAGLGAALSFYKVNGKPFVQMLEAGFNYYTGAKLFLWKRIQPKQDTPAVIAAQTAAAEASARIEKTAPRLTRGKLSELAWSLDVNRSSGPGTTAS